MKQITVLRFTIQLKSPMSIGSGESNDLHDAFVFVDANGLPSVPGTSLAGVLRRAWCDAFGDDSAIQYFGKTITRDEEDGGDSRVECSFGLLHDSQNRPTPMLVEEGIEDSLLESAKAPLTRQHVRINEHGAAADKGLYDRDMVPPGHRFSFEIKLSWQENEEPIDVQQVLALLSSPHVTLGAKSNTGLGQFDVIQAKARTFDLREKKDFNDYCQLSPCLSKVEQQLKSVDLKQLPGVEKWGGRTQDKVTLQLRLLPRGSWQVGGGIPTDSDVYGPQDGRQPQKVADIIPLREARVSWKEAKASFDPLEVQPVVPGSSILGPIRHRTTFYYNLETKKFADQLSSEEQVVCNSQRNQKIWPLFGGVDPIDQEQRPMAGKMIAEDMKSLLPGQINFQEHVTLDDFAAGAFSGHLFSEAFYWGGAWEVRIHINDPSSKVPTLLRKALKRTLRDLESGRLQIGAGDSRGHGRFELSESKWSDNGQWINRDGAGENS